MNMSRFHGIAVVVLVAMGVLLYGRTLSFPFVFDDRVYLTENPLVKNGYSFFYHGDFVAFSTLSKRLGLDSDISTNMILRPVTYFTFHVNYIIHGMKPQWFRAVNIAIHCANAVLLFLVLLHLLTMSRKSGSLSATSETFIAFTGAILFLVHPLQIESVTYIVQRFTSLAAFFYLFTILTYLIAYSAANRTTALFFRWTSVIGLVVGMLVKESLFTLPFMLLVLNWLVLGIPLKIVWRRVLPHFLCLLIIPALVCLTAWAQHGSNANITDALNIANPHPDANYPYHYALTQLSVVLSYLRLILVPYGLNLDPEYTLARSWMDMQVVGATLGIVGIVGGVWFWYGKCKEDARRSLCFASVIWYFVTLATSSSVIPLPDLMAEHRCYIATIGALTALACCVDMMRTYVADRRGGQYVVVGCVVVWVLALSAATVARNEVWRSAISLWTDTVAKSPTKFRPLINLGTAYVERGKLQEGISCYRKVLQIEPGVIAGYEALATVENSSGHHAEALLASEVGLQYEPGNWALHFNKAAAYDALGQKEKCIEWFKRTIKLRPTSKRSHIALGIVYASLKQYDDALKHYRIAASLSLPREFDAQLRFNIAHIEQMVQQRAGQSMAMSNR